MALHHDAKLDHLRAVRLFRNCSHKQLEHVASIVDEIDVEAGRVLCRQGETGHEAFVIVSGGCGDRGRRFLRQCRSRHLGR